MKPAARQTRVRWLQTLTDLPTAPGREEAVIGWVERWAAQRGLRIQADRAGNLILSLGSRSRRRPVVAVAHLDHPALVITVVNAGEAEAELRGGVLAPYLEGASVESGANTGKVVSFDADSGRAVLAWRGPDPVFPGTVFRWRFPVSALGIKDDILRARACDDLAGVAAALAALDRARYRELGHFSVLLTRAEEVGFVGAIAACELGSIPERAWVLSIECSRAFQDAPLGAGPVVRVGDASSVFSAALTNRLTDVVRARQIPHQRKLMSGGSCEATAFAALGWEATGLCLPLGNYHNMVDIDRVQARQHRARLAPEEISLADFHGLVDLLVAAAEDLDRPGPDLPQRLRTLYENERHVLEAPRTEHHA
ncbi:MAG TPA: M20/M25/M40 family metallo-hydrolase [Acidimicrobiia bacterium]|nr:M20/M25/M40 family metallo-hydrolase [Acidimicrobiia bacterium]